MATQRASVGGSALGLVLKGVAAMVAIATPLLGVWAASSIAAYLNGPVWAVVLSGLLLFPLGPMAWDAVGEWRRRSKPKAKRFLTFVDRLTLRTLAINLLFIAGLLGLAPARAFEALSTRGDWMLDGRDDATSSALRERLFWGAERLAWLYRASVDNPFDDMADPEARSGASRDVVPVPAADLPSAPVVPKDETPRTADGETATPRPEGEPSRHAEEPTAAPAERITKSWPLPAELHPAVVSLPKEAETSIASVAAYLKRAEPDPFWLVKALHDYVADRVAYDAPAYADGRYPPQDAQTVFDTRVGVCAGYANLLSALGREAGVPIVWVPGNARTQGWDIAGGGHAWNAAQIEGAWYLLDATWNAGSVDGRQFTKRYRTDYLFTPATIFGLDHLPDEPRWQLRDKPLSLGEFLRQPMLAPRFFASGLELVSPERSQITVAGRVDIAVRNPRGLFLLASFAALEGGESKTRCAVDNGPEVKVRCELPSEGRFDVSLFANEAQYGTFAFVGRIGVNNDF